MKKSISVLLALVLVLALCATAFAATTMYATEDGVPVYAEQDTASAVVTTLAKGESVQAEAADEGWYSVSGGYVQAAKLSTEKPCSHVWGDWQTQKEATCTEEGLMFRTCTLCSEEETHKIDKKPHSFGDWIIKVQPTCSKAGERYHLCKNCGLEESVKIDPLPHTYGSWLIRREATCTQTGLKSRWCTVCNFQQDVVIDKLPHNYNPWAVTLEATDHSAGLQARSCRDCGYTQQRSFDPEGTLRPGARGKEVKELQQLLTDQGYLKRNGVDGAFGGNTEKAVIAFQRDQGLEPDGVAWPQTIKRLHHDFGDWEVVTPYGRSEDGEWQRVCTECGYTEHLVIPTAPCLTRNATGNAVKSVQRMLQDLGYKCGTVDGAYGKKLERAWEVFALEHDITPETGRLRPADLDALVGAWLAELDEKSWAGQGDRTAPVDLVLTVTPAGEENGLLSFDWTVSNLGEKKARLITVLLAYGEDPDFSEGGNVVVIDGSRLKADNDNSLSGTFTISADWADGAETMSFCALATEDSTGAVWSSNVLSFDA